MANTSLASALNTLSERSVLVVNTYDHEGLHIADSLESIGRVYHAGSTSRHRVYVRERRSLARAQPSLA